MLDYDYAVQGLVYASSQRASFVSSLHRAQRLRVIGLHYWDFQKMLSQDFRHESKRFVIQKHVLLNVQRSRLVKGASSKHGRR